MSAPTTTIIQQGDIGDLVSQLQTQLQSLGYLNGAIDGDFGPGTLAAVQQFQQAQNLTADGVVGPQTWAALAAATGSTTQTTTPVVSTTAVVNAPAPSDTDTTSLAYRCLSLTGAFETSQKQQACFAGIAGNFDGMGMSFGCLQWNWGQRTLQPLIQEMDQQNSSIIDEYFGANAATLRQALGESLQQQLSWLNTIQDSGFHIQQPWHDQFSALGYDPAFQQIEVQAAQQRYNAAVGWCSTYNVTSERAVALMFDINVQDGSISQATQQLIQQDIQNLQSTGDPSQDEVAKLVIIANRRADAANPAAQADVRARKLTIANGQGTVHGIAYNIQNDFGITLNSAF
ncbi:MAG TPA: peptidoglycan-binding domain-containing protein [Fimbriimonadaceae bacterium]|jgi:hypothetical protein